MTLRQLVAACMDHAALEGRAGLSVGALFRAVEPSEDAGVRRLMWRQLRSSRALQFGRASSTRKRKRSEEDAVEVKQEASGALTEQELLQTTYEDAEQLIVVACEELRHRALNISVKAIAAELGEGHMKILEAVGRSRVLGVTVTALRELVGGSVKRIHNHLDTLLSYGLVVKRIMIVAKPTMRRLNIVHLPRFAAAFMPRMLGDSAEFESDDQSKKILCAAVEAYLKKLPKYSSVLSDLGRDLGLHKRQLEALRSYIIQESKAHDSFPLELFQAVLQPSRRTSLEPKILNCVRYKPPGTHDSGQLVPFQRGIVMELGLLRQIFGIIEKSADNGTTILDLRNQITLPGSKMPYKLIGHLAAAYGLKAESIIMGRNKAFRLYLDSVTPRFTSEDSAAPVTPPDMSPVPVSPSTDSPDTAPEVSKAESLSSARPLKTLGTVEIHSTVARRCKHILERLEDEKIISLSSLRASVHRMEKLDTSLNGSVGLVDTRSIFRLATELERAKKLRLLQLPLPARNVSTKFRALRCVVYPGYENNDSFIQAYVRNYCRDERIRRIHQNSESGEVVRFQKFSSDDIKRPVTRKRRRPNTATNSNPTEKTAAKNGSSDANRANEIDPESSDPGTPPPHEVSYRIRRFVSQQKSGVHLVQYKRLGFAYGVMYRCKVLHRFLWTTLHQSRLDDENGVTIEDLDDDDVNEPNVTAVSGDRPTVVPRREERPAVSKGIVFSREAVLHAMPIHLYVQIFSGGTTLTDSEFAIMEEAIANKRSFDDIPKELRDKVWKDESQRTAKVLGTLADLGLLVPHKIGMKRLVEILRVGYTDGKDGVLSQALQDNALGGLFRLNKLVRIELNDMDGDDSTTDTTEQRNVNTLDSLRIVGFTEKSYTFGNTLPLQFTLQSECDVDRYWEALECLCLEHMAMEVDNPRKNEPSVREVPKPVRTRARRMLRVLAWIPKSRKPAPKQKRKDGDDGDAPCSGIVSTHIRARKKRRLSQNESSATDQDGNSAVVKSKKKKTKSRTDSGEVQRRAVADTITWKDEHDQLLLDLYIENCRSRWKIVVPQSLQREKEQIAFRNHSISRSGFGLVSIARKLGKRKIDVKKRLKERLIEPMVKLIVERAKREAQLADNPGGAFDEEVAIRGSPRLTALFRRAVMMIVSPREEYQPLVAEELISYWNAHEVRLVWRYLWLKNWIVRASEKERGRGYATSQRLQDALKVNTLSYPLLLFQQAAEQESMVSSTLEEITPDRNALKSRPDNSDSLFEDDFPMNATPGQCALELGCQVLGTCSLSAFHSVIASGIDVDMASEEESLSTRKNQANVPKGESMRLLGKSLKDGSGFASHLANKVNVKKPSELIDCWRVETKMHGVTVEDADFALQFEAFSNEESDDNSGLGSIAFQSLHHCQELDKALGQTLVRCVRDSGESGLTLSALLDKLQQAPEDDLRSASLMRVARCLNTLIDEDVLLCVNAYYEQRYILKEYGDVWLLRPFSLVPGSGSSSKPCVVFEGEKDTLSFPWLKMDGGTNCKFLFAIQRKLLSMIIQSPGLTEARAYAKMDKLLSVQDTREALSLLVEEGLVYARAVRHAAKGAAAPVSLFGPQATQPSVPQVVKLVGNVLAYDRVVFEMHYFPHVECIQRFGSIVKDYQNEVSEFQRD